MVERIWFRLLIRALGVLFIGLSVPAIVSLAGGLASSLTSTNAAALGSSEWTMYYVGTGLGYGLEAGFGIYLLFFGEGLIRKCIADTLGRCAVCQYDLHGQTGDTCPECGTPFRTPSPAP